MDEIWRWAVERLSPEWFLGACFLIYIFERTGFVQRLFREKTEERISARDLLSQDQRDLLDRYRREVVALGAELNTQRNGRRKDEEYYRGQIDGLRAQVNSLNRQADTMADTMASMERGNARYRHGLNGALQHIAALHRTIAVTGNTSPRYDGWQSMLGIDDDLDRTLPQLFDRRGGGERRRSDDRRRPVKHDEGGPFPDRRSGDDRRQPDGPRRCP